MFNNWKVCILFPHLLYFPVYYVLTACQLTTVHKSKIYKFSITKCIHFHFLAPSIFLLCLYSVSVFSNPYFLGYL